MTSWIAFRPEAEREIEQAYDWYEAQRSGLGLEFLLALDAVLSRATGNPRAFPRVARRTHRAILRRFPYLVFYVAEGDHLLITGLFHGHRDPEHWSDRVYEAMPKYGPTGRVNVAT